MNTPRYVSGHTTHIYYQHGPEVWTRFAHDTQTRLFDKLELWDGLSWRSADDYCRSDMVEWITQHSIDELAELVDDFKLSSAG